MEITEVHEIQTSNEDLVKLVKAGHFFTFCIAFALNKGFRNAIKEKKDVCFMVGDYNVEFDHEQMCFKIIHKEYFLRIIHAYYQHIFFTGDSEEEIINDLLVELEKEILLPK